MLKINVNLLVLFILFPLIVSPANLIWKKGIKAEVNGSPAVYKEKIVVGVKNGDILCFNSDSKLLWSLSSGSAIFSSPVIDKRGNIFIALYNGKFIKLNLKGEKLLEIDTGVNLRSTPLLIDSKIIIVSEKGKVIALEKNSGKKIWEKKFKNECFSSPVCNKKTIYIPMKNNSLTAISSDGKNRWEFKTKGVIFSSPAIASDGSVYITSMDHYLYKIGANGKLIWKFKTGRWIISSPVIDADGNIYFGSYDRFFYSVTKEGKLRWKFRGKGSFNATAVLDSKGNVYTGNSSGHIFGFSKDGKELWKYLTDDFVRRPLTIIPGEKVLISGSLDKNLYAFKIDGTISPDSHWSKYLGNSLNSGRK